MMGPDGSLEGALEGERPRIGEPVKSKGQVPYKPGSSGEYAIASLQDAAEDHKSKIIRRVLERGEEAAGYTFDDRFFVENGRLWVEVAGTRQK
jgi:hypothetical protein